MDENQKLVLTPSGLIAFLSQIEELDGKDSLAISEADDGSGLTVYIGDSTYRLQPEFDSEVEVAPEVVDELSSIDDSGYDDLGDDFEEIDDEAIEGGILKELIKTLAIGGLVRMTKNAIKNA